MILQPTYLDITKTYIFEASVKAWDTFGSYIAYEILINELLSRWLFFFELQIGISSTTHYEGIHI